jgi:hypothetical protein
LFLLTTKNTHHVALAVEITPLEWAVFVLEFESFGILGYVAQGSSIENRLVAGNLGPNLIVNNVTIENKLEAELKDKQLMGSHCGGVEQRIILEIEN